MNDEFASDADVLVEAVQQDIRKTLDHEVGRAVAKERGFVRWDKVYDKDGHRIWHWRFRRFYWKDYKRQTHVSIIENPDTLAIATVRYDDKNRRIAESRIIISFRYGKVRTFRMMGKTLRGYSPLTDWAVRFPYSDAVEQINPIDYPLLMRCERRLIKIFIDKCRANNIKVSPYARRAAKTLKDLISYILYPAVLDLASVKQPLFHKTSKIIAPYLRRSFKNSLKLISGHNSRYLTKLVLAKKPEHFTSTLIRLRLFKGMLPIDYLHQLINSQDNGTLGISYHSDWKADWSKTRAFLSLFKDRPAVLARWLRESPEWLWRDTINMWEVTRIEPGFVMPETNDLQVIHDELARRQRARMNAMRGEPTALPSYEDREIKYPNTLIFCVNGISVGEYTLVVPKTTHELMRWGNEMVNCIGGYSYMIESGYSWIVGLVKEDICHYGIEIDPAHIEFRQFKGKYNKDAPVGLDVQVKDVIDSAILAAKSLDMMTQS